MTFTGRDDDHFTFEQIEEIIKSDDAGKISYAWKELGQTQRPLMDRYTKVGLNDKLLTQILSSLDTPLAERITFLEDHINVAEEMGNSRNMYCTPQRLADALSGEDNVLSLDDLTEIHTKFTKIHETAKNAGISADHINRVLFSARDPQSDLNNINILHQLTEALIEQTPDTTTSPSETRHNTPDISLENSVS